MAEIGYTRNLYLRGICAIYLFAFISFYIQIPGLYGNNGILPARTQLQDSTSRLFIEKFRAKPTLLWFAPYFGLNTEYMMDVISLMGVFFAFMGLISQQYCTGFLFATLWFLYLSLNQVGQTFMWFQWDALLLEVGFLTIWISPWKSHTSKSRHPLSTPIDEVMFFLVRWLLFRFMFSSGIVKLQSGCPTWWGLTALNVHFESQPLPTPFAWFMHHAPTWFLKLGTVYTHIVEQAMPFLFFFPHRGVRMVGFFLQVFLQLSIMISGNYNFFNFLTIILCLSLLDDQFFFSKKKGKSGFYKRILSLLINVFVHGFIIYLGTIFYSLKITPKWTIESEITFTKSEFDKFVKHAIPAAMYISGLTFLKLCVQAVFHAIKPNGQSSRNKFNLLLITAIYLILGLFLYGISFVPFTSLHRSTNSSILSPFREVYNQLEGLQVSNSYGLFRRMTGVGGRPEVVIEGANDLNGPWLEYHFKYKPGDVNSSTLFVAPYQPRIDWQMWFAALGTYHQNPWLMSTAYRILEGEKSVLQLMNTKRLPFPSKPPKYLKASLYHYHYTPWTQRNSRTWWKRESVGEYFPIFAKDHAPLVDYLKQVRILDTKEKLNADNNLVFPWFKILLDWLRQYIGAIDPFILEWSVFLAACVIISASATLNANANTHKKKA